MKDFLKLSETDLKADQATELSVISKSKSLALCSSREARACLDFRDACRFKALPLLLQDVKGGQVVRFAVGPDYNPQLKKELAFATGLNVELSSVNEDILIPAIRQAYKTDDCWLAENVDELKSLQKPSVLRINPDKDLNENETVPKALRVILEYAIAREASDIHLIPAVSGLLLRLRIKGEIFHYRQELSDYEIGQRLLSRIKILAKLRTDLKYVPQDGSFSIKLDDQTRQIRVSFMPTIHGEKCVMRITSRALEFSVGNLGFSESTEGIIRDVLSLKQGLVLLCGATGSGKTTTLYALVQELVKLNLNVVSIEDPVESVIEGVSQTSLDLQRGLDYPTALKSILRQDPDVILVGEIRDADSAELVITAALSGHLVLSTVHAGSVKDCILRLEDFGCNQSALAAAIKLIINQSLLQGLCGKCKVLDLSLSNMYGFRIYRAVGCAECGYSGFDLRLLAIERVYFKNAGSMLQVKSGDIELAGIDIYESKQSYLENYLKQGLILPPV